MREVGGPKDPFKTDEMPTECLAETRARDKETHALLTGDIPSLDNVTRCEEYSSLSRLLSVTAYVLKFVQTLRQAVKGRRFPSSSIKVDAQELSAAEMMWILESQRQLVEDKLFPTWKQ